MTLVYANRTHRTVMFLDDLHDLKDRYPERFHLVHVCRASRRRSSCSPAGSTATGSAGS